ncbi:hypothetical protein DIPPA_24208 [Diplonema papillatum]|nr:hypothetical protein DIPPA_24208 [Diplonema papillatum]
MPSTMTTREHRQVVERHLREFYELTNPAKAAVAGQILSRFWPDRLEDLLSDLYQKYGDRFTDTAQWCSLYKECARATGLEYGAISTPPTTRSLEAVPPTYSGSDRGRQSQSTGFIEPAEPPAYDRGRLTTGLMEIGERDRWAKEVEMLRKEVDLTKETAKTLYYSTEKERDEARGAVQQAMAQKREREREADDAKRAALSEAARSRELEAALENLHAEVAQRTLRISELDRVNGELSAALSIVDAKAQRLHAQKEEAIQLLSSRTDIADAQQKSAAARVHTLQRASEALAEEYEAKVTEAVRDREDMTHCVATAMQELIGRAEAPDGDLRAELGADTCAVVLPAALAAGVHGCFVEGVHVAKEALHNVLDAARDAIHDLKARLRSASGAAGLLEVELRDAEGRREAEGFEAKERLEISELFAGMLVRKERRAHELWERRCADSVRRLEQCSEELLKVRSDWDQHKQLTDERLRGVGGSADRSQDLEPDSESRRCDEVTVSSENARSPVGTPQDDDLQGPPRDRSHACQNPKCAKTLRDNEQLRATTRRLRDEVMAMQQALPALERDQRGAAAERDELLAFTDQLREQVRTLQQQHQPAGASSDAQSLQNDRDELREVISQLHRGAPSSQVSADHPSEPERGANNRPSVMVQNLQRERDELLGLVDRMRDGHADPSDGAMQTLQKERDDLQAMVVDLQDQVETLHANFARPSHAGPQDPAMARLAGVEAERDDLQNLVNRLLAQQCDGGAAGGAAQTRGKPRREAPGEAADAAGGPPPDDGLRKALWENQVLQWELSDARRQRDELAAQAAQRAGLCAELERSLREGGEENECLRDLINQQAALGQELLALAKTKIGQKQPPGAGGPFAVEQAILEQSAALNAEKESILNRMQALAAENDSLRLLVLRKEATRDARTDQGEKQGFLAMITKARQEKQALAARIDALLRGKEQLAADFDVHAKAAADKIRALEASLSLALALQQPRAEHGEPPPETHTPLSSPEIGPVDSVFKSSARVSFHPTRPSPHAGGSGIFNNAPASDSGRVRECLAAAEARVREVQREAAAAARDNDALRRRLAAVEPPGPEPGGISVPVHTIHEPGRASPTGTAAGDPPRWLCALRQTADELATVAGGSPPGDGDDLADWVHRQVFWLVGEVKGWAVELKLEGVEGTAGKSRVEAVRQVVREEREKVRCLEAVVQALGKNIKDPVNPPRRADTPALVAAVSPPPPPPSANPSDTMTDDGSDVPECEPSAIDHDRLDTVRKLASHASGSPEETSPTNQAKVDSLKRQLEAYESQLYASTSERDTFIARLETADQKAVEASRVQDMLRTRLEAADEKARAQAERADAAETALAELRGHAAEAEKTLALLEEALQAARAEKAAADAARKRLADELEEKAGEVRGLNEAAEAHRRQLRQLQSQLQQQQQPRRAPPRRDDAGAKPPALASSSLAAVRGGARPGGGGGSGSSEASQVDQLTDVDSEGSVPRSDMTGSPAGVAVVDEIRWAASEEEKAALREQIEELKLCGETTERQVDALRQRIDAEREYAEQKADMKELEFENRTAGLRGEIEELVAGRKILIERAEAVDSQCDNLQQHINNLTSKFETVSLECDSLQLRLDHEAQQHDTLMQQVKTLLNENDALTRMVRNTETLEGAKRLTSAQEVHWRSLLHLELQEQVGRLSLISAEHAIFQTMWKEWPEASSTWSGIAALQKETDGIRRELCDVYEARQEEKAAIGSLKGQIAALQEANSAELETARALRKEAKDAEAALKRAQKTAVESAEALAGREAACGELAAAARARDARLRDAADELSISKQREAVLEAQVEQLRNELNAYHPHATPPRAPSSPPADGFSPSEEPAMHRLGSVGAESAPLHPTPLDAFAAEVCSAAFDRDVEEGEEERARLVADLAGLKQRAAQADATDVELQALRSLAERVSATVLGRAGAADEVLDVISGLKLDKSAAADLRGFVNDLKEVVMDCEAAGDVCEEERARLLGEVARLKSEAARGAEARAELVGLADVAGFVADLQAVVTDCEPAEEISEEDRAELYGAVAGLKREAARAKEADAQLLILADLRSFVHTLHELVAGCEPAGDIDDAEQTLLTDEIERLKREAARVEDAEPKLRALDDLQNFVNTLHELVLDCEAASSGEEDRARLVGGIETLKREAAFAEGARPELAVLADLRSFANDLNEVVMDCESAGDVCEEARARLIGEVVRLKHEATRTTGNAPCHAFVEELVTALDGQPPPDAAEARAWVVREVTRLKREAGHLPAFVDELLTALGGQAPAEGAEAWVVREVTRLKQEAGHPPLPHAFAAELLTALGGQAPAEGAEAWVVQEVARLKAAAAGEKADGGGFPLPAPCELPAGSDVPHLVASLPESPTPADSLAALVRFSAQHLRPLDPSASLPMHAASVRQQTEYVAQALSLQRLPSAPPLAPLVEAARAVFQVFPEHPACGGPPATPHEQLDYCAEALRLARDALSPHQAADRPSPGVLAKLAQLALTARLYIRPQERAPVHSFPADPAQQALLVEDTLRHIVGSSAAGALDGLGGLHTVPRVVQLARELSPWVTLSRPLSPGDDLEFVAEVLRAAVLHARHWAEYERGQEELTREMRRFCGGFFAGNVPEAREDWLRWMRDRESGALAAWTDGVAAADRDAADREVAELRARLFEARVAADKWQAEAFKAIDFERHAAVQMCAAAEVRAELTQQVARLQEESRCAALASACSTSRFLGLLRGTAWPAYESPPMHREPAMLRYKPEAPGLMSPSRQAT